MIRTYFFIICLFIANCIYSQIFRNAEANRIIANSDLIKFKSYTKVPNYIHFNKNSNISIEEAENIVSQFIENSNSKIKLKKIQKNDAVSQTIRYQQTINDIILEFSAINFHVINNKVIAINGDALSETEISPQFLITENQAFNIALNYIKADTYAWENSSYEKMLKEFKNDENATFFPKGVKIICTEKPDFKNKNLKSAYKFDIYSLKPLARKMVYIDASNGEVLFDLPLLYSSDEIGNAVTAYYGTQQINTEYTSGHYILKDNTRGSGIHTYNRQNTTYLELEFTDNDNYWNNINPQLDQYATDAHFCTMKTYDYYLYKHGFHSIDDDNFPLVSYVHHDLMSDGYGNNINAFWNGLWMTYGDGSPANGITPLTTIDICGHEITHGLTNFTADLIYGGESGALNEAFSDIFGTCIEFYAVPADANWLVGEKTGYLIRSIANPNMLENPKNYKGIFWDYSEEVHKNSCPFAHWFYLVAEGGSGTNDFFNQYNVQGIGIYNAEKIAFKLLTQFLTPQSGYEDACFLGLQATAEIFGYCSPEVQTVGDAFYAIAVLEEPFQNDAKAQFNANITENCTAPQIIQFFNSSYNCNSYLWYFGDGTTSTQQNPTHTYNEFGNYSVSLKVSNNICNSDSITKENYINISPDLPCAIIMSGTQTVTSCSAFIYDEGGSYGNYPDNSESKLTINAPGANMLVFDFQEFSIEPNNNDGDCSYDYLTISGNGFYEVFCNNNPPIAPIEIYGNTATLNFFSDLYMNYSGYKIKYFCVNPDNPPVSYFNAFPLISCDGIVEFTNNSYGQVDSYFWNFGDGFTSTEQNPTHQYYQNGNYIVSLTTTNTNGNNTLTKNNYIKVEQMEEHTDTIINVCNDQQFEINLTNFSQNAKWYSNLENNIVTQQPIHSGNTWQHEAITETTEYFVNEKFIGPTFNVGENVYNSGGSYYNTYIAFRYLCFNAYQPFLLKSLWINAEVEGDVTIYLTDIQLNVYDFTVVHAHGGPEQIEVNIEVPAGMNWCLGAQATTDLFRSDITATLNYPYKIDGIVSINYSNANGNIYDYYYYFYKWEIKLHDCFSEISKITLIPDICTNISLEETDEINIFPNPTIGQLTISSEIYKQRTDIIRDIEIFDIFGKKLKDIKEINFDNSFNISELSNGVYFIKFIINERVYCRKVVKI